MQFACKNEKDYISSLEDWGFLFKIDLELEAFSDAQTKCDSIDRKYEQKSVEEIKYSEDAVEVLTNQEDKSDEELRADDQLINETKDQEYIDAIMTPEIYPDAVVTYNIDPQCGMHNMF